MNIKVKGQMKNYYYRQMTFWIIASSTLFISSCSNSKAESKVAKAEDTLQQIALFDNQGNETMIYLDKQTGDTLERISSFNANGEETITYKKKSSKTTTTQNKADNTDDTIAQVAFFDASGKETIYYISKKTGDTLEYSSSVDGKSKERKVFKRKTK